MFICKKTYYDYLNDIEEQNEQDCYSTLKNKVNKKLQHLANMNYEVLKNEFVGVKLKGIKDDVLSSFKICSDEFLKITKLVSSNSDNLQRMFLNAVYSSVFNITLSESIFLTSYEKKGITYGVLRTLVYLRNGQCSVKQFLGWQMEIKDPENAQKIDFDIFEVLGIYKRYIINPEYIDNLIMIHRYTCDVWKNGAKHLYFYTLHNQEHAIDLVKNIVKLVKIFRYLKISSYDYYILFIACYLHDMSMVGIASENDFLLDRDDSEKITTELDIKWNKSKSMGERKKVAVEAYRQVDSFFEKKIRSMHAKDSAEEIRTRSDLNFLEPGVRESVADVVECHMMDVEDIYFIKGEAKNRLISSKFNQILLRLADLLDMSEHRISKPFLNHNIDNMSTESAFHWISHLLTVGYDFSVKYSGDSTNDAVLGSVTETIILSIFVKLSQFSKYETKHCTCCSIMEDSIKGSEFELKMNDKGSACNSEKCNFLCRWFNEKNAYLVSELQALESYLRRVPLVERFSNTKIRIKVIVSNPTNLASEQFEIIKHKIKD